MLYGYYMLAALGEDFAPVILKRKFGLNWAQTLESLRQGAQLAPSIVL